LYRRSQRHEGILEARRCNLKDFLKDKLGKHEMISALEIRDALPRTAVGKLSKKELYDEDTKKRVP
jgi:long-chain acyl-CoA synthetase